MSAPAPRRTDFRPPEFVDRTQVLARSDTVLARPDIPVAITEDVFRIEELGMAWDIGVEVHTPENPDDQLRTPDGRAVGMFLTHGGAGDFKSIAPLSNVFSRKYGAKVVAFTFPGRFYLDDPSRDWPGDTINPDGTVRTPIWQQGEYVTPDQYELVRDPGKRMKYGIRTHARARPGSRFYDRMASWPAAFEEAMKEACRRHFPTDTHAIFVHGHSTGGPYVSMLSQRVANIAGVFALENSSFGYINEQKHIWGGHVGKIEGYERVATTGESWRDPFTDLYVRTWRDLARYRGPEALGQEGPNALMRLPWLMEEILDKWDKAKKRPQFKAEYPVTHNIVGALEAAARTAATRLGMNAAATASLVERYLGYSHELKGPDARPVPPFYFVITKDSRDHSPEVYREVILPMFAGMDPAPKTAVTRLGAGVHTYTTPEDGLPQGVTPMAADLFVTAVREGFFAP